MSMIAAPEKKDLGGGDFHLKKNALNAITVRK